MLSMRISGDVRMRTLEPWNAAEFAEFTRKHREFLAPWLPWATIIVDEATAAAFLKRYAGLLQTDSGRIFGLWDGDELIGGTLFRTFDSRLGNCEIGVWLAPHATGRGLVTRAASLMIDWAVLERGMSRVEWLCDTENTASKAVAARLGMTHEGTMRRYYPINGRRPDAELWAVLADEWRARRSDS